MIAVDTNVVVRFLVGDDREQARRAGRLFGESAVFVPHTVLLEAEWVLRRGYRFTRERIAGAFIGLLGVETVACVDGDAVRRAIDAFASGCDFADAMHAATAGEVAAEFVTFDRDFAKRATIADLPVVRLL
jgi:predicted nucleic-acid-binding protein